MEQNVSRSSRYLMNEMTNYDETMIIVYLFTSYNVHLMYILNLTQCLQRGLNLRAE